MNGIQDLIDGKIESIYFDFSANNVGYSQNLVFLIGKLNISTNWYKLIFYDTSSFQMNIKIGEQSIYPSNYAGDSLYIQSVLCLKKSEFHEHWRIELIDNEGNIDIFSNGVNIETA